MVRASDLPTERRYERIQDQSCPTQIECKYDASYPEHVRLKLGTTNFVDRVYSRLVNEPSAIIEKASGPVWGRQETGKRDILLLLRRVVRSGIRDIFD